MPNPNPKPRCLEPPQIHGEGTAGSVLRCHPGVWEGADQLSVQWLKFGKPVLKADVYFIQDTDIARPISACVIATNKAGRTVSPRSNIIKGKAAQPHNVGWAEPPPVAMRIGTAQAAPPPGDFRPIATTIPEIVLAAPPPPRRIARPS